LGGKPASGVGALVIPIGQIARHAKDYTHIIIVTEPNPSEDDFKEAAEGCEAVTCSLSQLGPFR
jgi:hypothetical protein